MHTNFFHKAALVSALFLASISTLWAQTGTTPYTAIGIGQLTHRGTTRNVGMGGMGVSAASPLQSNLLNPAMLTYNSLTVFEASYIGEQKTLISGQDEQESFSANIEYINFVFPVNTRWKTSIGLQPISKVNYSARAIEKVEGSPDFVENRLRGTGGLSRVYWANGYFVGKGLSLGLQFNYNFGKISRESEFQVFGEDYVPGQFLRENYSKFTIQPGVHYSRGLGKDRSVNFGGTVSFASDYNVTFFESLERRNENDIIIDSDSTIFDDSGIVRFPTKYTLGISYEKLGKFLIGIDFTQENWSEFDNPLRNESLNDIFKINFGTEYTPDYTSISNYLKRISYRAGFAYEELLWNASSSQELANASVDSYSFSGGFSLPLNRNFASLNFGVVYGVVNASEPTMVEENYTRYHIGVTINDRWFVKRKVN